MTREAIQTFVNDNLLDGRTMDEDLFGILINLAKTKVEQSRPWVKIRSEDSSGAITAANTWQTTHTLPTRFAQPYPVKRRNGVYSSLILVSSSEVLTPEEIQWAQRLEYQDIEGYFAIDYANDRYILTGSYARSYVPYWSFIQFSPSLDDDGDEWIFPSQFHAVLGYLVAILEKARDYDEVNMANIAAYSPEAAAIVSAMTMWDTNLQRAMHNV